MNLLIVEDDEDLLSVMKSALLAEGYQIESCLNGLEAIDYALSYSYDLYIFDRMLPGLDGLSALKQIRSKGHMTPAILVTALNGINDRIDGLDAGADDYLIKPFALEELLARVRALLRRPHLMFDDNTIEFADLSLNTNDLTLHCGKESITLSKKESALLEYFMRNKSQTLKREQLLLRVWGSDTDIEAGNLDTYIYFLRRRLKTVHSKTLIQTVHGQGYRLSEET